MKYDMHSSSILLGKISITIGVIKEILHRNMFSQQMECINQQMFSFALRKNILKLLLALCCHHCLYQFHIVKLHFWITVGFSFTNSNEYVLTKLREFMFTVLNYLFVTVSLFASSSVPLSPSVPLRTTQKRLILPQLYMSSHMLIGDVVGGWTHYLLFCLGVVLYFGFSIVLCVTLGSAILPYYIKTFGFF